MPDLLNPMQVLSLPQSMTRFQHAFTDYEYEHYEKLGPAKRQQIEHALTVISDSAGRLYAYSVVLSFEGSAAHVTRLRTATAKIDATVKSLRTWQRIFDVVSSVAALAAAITGHDAEGIIGALDELYTQIAA